MIKLSRRKFLCGVAAIAVAAPAVLPKPEPTPVLWVSTNKQLMAFINGEVKDVSDYVEMWADLKDYGNYFEKIEFEAGRFTRTRIDPKDVWLT